LDTIIYRGILATTALSAFTDEVAEEAVQFLPFPSFG
jgi:hypothetical protein